MTITFSNGQVLTAEALNNALSEAAGVKPAGVNPANPQGYTWAGPQFFNKFGGGKNYQEITIDTTLTAEDQGTVFIVGGGPTITIPSIGAGANFEFIVNGPPLNTSINTAYLYFPDTWLYHAGIGLINGNSGAQGSKGATYELSGTLRCVQIIQGSGYNWNIAEDNDLSSLQSNGGIASALFQATNSQILTGTTAGFIVSSTPEQGVAKKFVAYANGYENDTTTAQTITFPMAFVNVPVITTNTTGLSLAVNTTEMAINAPNNTTTYSGVIIVEGI